MKPAEEWKAVPFYPLGSDKPASTHFACPVCNVAFVVPVEHECPPSWMKQQKGIGMERHYTCENDKRKSMTEQEMYARAEAICAELKGRVSVNLREEIEWGIVQMVKESQKG